MIIVLAMPAPAPVVSRVGLVEPDLAAATVGEYMAMAAAQTVVGGFKLRTLPCSGSIWYPVNVVTSCIEITVVGARGGHGATTVAGAIGMTLDAPLVSRDIGSLRWLWPGTSARIASEDQVQVIDSGAFDARSAMAPAVLVVRGPSSLAIKTVSSCHQRFNHVVLIREPNRPLRRVDVETALRTQVVAEIPYSPRIARIADAGLLTDQFERLNEFDDLRDWTLRTWSDTTMQRPW